MVYDVPISLKFLFINGTLASSLEFRPTNSSMKTGIQEESIFVTCDL